MKRILGLLVFLCAAKLLLPQTQAHLEPRIANLNYPALAKQARVEGAVSFMVTGVNSVTGKLETKILKGHPLLAATASDNLAQWRMVGEFIEEVLVEFQFILLEPEFGVKKVLRGDAVDRFFLKIFHKPIYRDETYCTNTPKEDIRSLKPRVSNSPKEVIIRVVAAEACLEPVSAQTVTTW